MIRKIYLILVTIFIASSLIIPFSSNANAADISKCEAAKKGGTASYEACLKTLKGENTPAFDGRDGEEACNGFLGLTSWDCGVHIKDEESLKSGIWQIVANIASDITVIAAYLVLGYVIYGGYLYIFSAGESTKATAGKKTLTQAFIGLAIVMSAYVIMNSIRIALLGTGGAFNCNLANSTGCPTANEVVTNAIQWFIGMAGVVAVIFIVYGGIAYTTSAGDASKLDKAKKTITYALIGLAIVGLAEVITAFVSNTIRNANANTSQITTPKEYNENQII